MQASQGHSRKESDDFSKLFFGNSNENLEVGGENFVFETSLHPSLSFHQPKSSFTFIYFFGLVRGIDLRQIFKACFKAYVHPVGALATLLVAIVVPVVLGCIVFHNDHKERGDWLVIDKSLQSFQIPGHISAQHEDMVTVARKPSTEIKHKPQRRSRRKRSTPDISPTGHTHRFQKNPKWTLELVYLATGEGDLNIFTKERIETIHQIEQRLLQQDRFPDFCWKWSEAGKDLYLPNSCTPPISLIDFIYPSVTKDQKWRINDGQGMGYGPNNEKKLNLTDESINQSLDLLLTKPFTYWFVDSTFSSHNRKSRFLRAEVKFGSPLNYWKYGYSRHAQFKAFKAFLVKYAEAVGKMSTDKVRVLYGGNVIFDYEVNKTLWADIRLSIFTMAFVGAFVLLFTRFSIFLTIIGIISILTPLCSAYFLFRIAFGIKSLGILSGISLFIIIGIGVDDVFVFINTFRQAHSAKSLESRLAHTLSTAGKATFFTSFTTTAAFAANCVSEMPAIYNFGLFMALIVFSCWLTVFCTIPPALNLWHRYISKAEEIVFRLLFGWMKSPCGTGNSSLPDDIVQFLSGNDRNDTASQTPFTTVEEFELSSRSAVQDDDDDSLLVQLNSSPPVSQSPSPSSSNSDLAMYDDPNSTFDLQTAPLMRRTSSRPARARDIHLRDQQNKACTCGGGLQGLLYHWLGVPIKQYPLVVGALFLGVLGASIALDTQIKPSAKPPEFFKESTNLQQLLNLKYNMSGDNLNVNDLAWDLIGTEIKQTNNANNPTTKPTPKHTETNGIRSSTSSPATAEQPGRRPDSNIQAHHSASSKSSTVADTSTTVPRRISPTPPTTTKYISPIATKRRQKPTAKQHKRVTAKPKTQSTVLPTRVQRHKTGDSGNVDKPTTVLPEDKTLPPLCPGGCKPIDKPIVDTSATVYVVFGLKSIDRSKIIRESVISKKGDVIPDYEFTDLVLKEWPKFLMYACRLCKKLSNNSELVQPGGADCFPSWIMDYIHSHTYRHDSWNKDCLELTSASYLSGKSRAKMYEMPSKDRSHGNDTFWMMMAFESTVFMGKSSQERVRDFDNWNKFLKEELKTYPKGFQTGFQTSIEWVYTFTEVVAVNSAIYGIAFSLVLCLGSVAVFTANFFLTLIVMITILGVLSSVVAIFYLASWQLGAVEAISLSILVGTSVDYCVHLVEGYIMAGNFIPNLHENSNKEIRGWRSLAAVSHIGTAILSSAITTVVASIPLCLTTIQLFAKFGQILAINTAVSIFFTLSICVALLCLIAPVRFRASFKWSLIALFVVAVVFSLGAFILFLINWKVVTIPGPAGEPLFPQP